jgi:hypothetical protein
MSTALFAFLNPVQNDSVGNADEEVDPARHFHRRRGHDDE